MFHSVPSVQGPGCSSAPAALREEGQLPVADFLNNNDCHGRIPEALLFLMSLPSSRYDLTYPFSLLAVSPHLLSIPVCVFRKAFDADWN